MPSTTFNIFSYYVYVHCVPLFLPEMYFYWFSLNNQLSDLILLYVFYFLIYSFLLFSFSPSSFLGKFFNVWIDFIIHIFSFILIKLEKTSGPIIVVWVTLFTFSYFSYYDLFLFDPLVTRIVVFNFQVGKDFVFILLLLFFLKASKGKLLVLTQQIFRILICMRGDFSFKFSYKLLVLFVVVKENLACNISDLEILLQFCISHVINSNF